MGICSRNFDLKLNEENKDNSFVKTVTEAGYLEQLPKLYKSVAIQGELCGPGIQGNKYKMNQHELFVFDVWLIDQQRHATRDERWEILNDLIRLGIKVSQVPHLGTTKIPGSVKECLALAEGKSKINPKAEREGIVFKSTSIVDGEVKSFKAISNLFLLKEK